MLQGTQILSRLQSPSFTQSELDGWGYETTDLPGPNLVSRWIEKRERSEFWSLEQGTKKLVVKEECSRRYIYICNYNYVALTTL